METRHQTFIFKDQTILPQNSVTGKTTATNKRKFLYIFDFCFFPLLFEFFNRCFYLFVCLFSANQMVSLNTSDAVGKPPVLVWSFSKACAAKWATHSPNWQRAACYQGGRCRCYKFFQMGKPASTSSGLYILVPKEELSVLLGNAFLACSLGICVLLSGSYAHTGE